MPIYEYECQHCNQVTEAMQKFSEPPLTQCPKCQGALKKLISHSAFHLKGSGWYVTDYARKGDSAPLGSQDKPAETSHKAPEKTSDTAASTTTTGGTADSK
jgi:putative FmdB family regulatory protein